MSTRQINFVENEFYHIFNRGVDKRPLFVDLEDYKRILSLLYICNSSERIELKVIKRNHDSVFDYPRQDALVAIGAYCLMPNHFHLLLTPLTEDGVTKFMGKLMTGYSMYFNKKYQRTGTLYEGPFKSKHASSDQYLKYLYAYIHLNPIKLMPETGVTKTKESTIDFLNQYLYSSWPDYRGQNREEGQILNTEPFPEYFRTSAEHLDELKSWLSFTEQ